MNVTVVQVHDALRNYRSLLKKDFAKNVETHIEGEAAQLVKNNVQISKEAFAKLEASQKEDKSPAVAVASPTGAAGTQLPLVALYK